MSPTSYPLVPYTLQPPGWRDTLTSGTQAYPELYPGTSALYPQQSSASGSSSSSVPGSGSSSANYAGQSRDAANVDTGIVGLTKAREEDLSEAVVKSGLVCKPVVQSETFSAHQLIYPKFAHGHSLIALSRLVSRVVDKRRSSSNLTPQPGPWTFKPPARVVFNDVRREAWLNDLANPAIPLSKLSKSIPNTAASVSAAGTGTYGGASRAALSGGGIAGGDRAADKNLEILLSRQVETNRAIWFLRSVQGAEAQSLKGSRSTSSSNNPSTHSFATELTLAVVDLLKRLLHEVVLPLTHQAGLGLSSRPGMSVKGRARNILGEEQGRKRFLSRWDWSMALLAGLLRESMLDCTKLCEKLLEWLAQCHTAQIIWVTGLLRDFCLPVLEQLRIYSRAFLHTAVKRLEELGDTPALAESVNTSTFTNPPGTTTSSSGVDGSRAGLTPDKLPDEARQALFQLLRTLWRLVPDAMLLPTLVTHAEKGRWSSLRRALVQDGDDEERWRALTERINALLCNGLTLSQSLRIDISSSLLEENGSASASAKARPLANTPLRRLGKSRATPTILAYLDTFACSSGRSSYGSDGGRLKRDAVASLCDRFFFDAPASTGRSHAGAGEAASTSVDGGNDGKAQSLEKLDLPVHDRIVLLLDWSCSRYRFGPHRRPLAVNMLVRYIHSRSEQQESLAEIVKKEVPEVSGDPRMRSSDVDVNDGAAEVETRKLSLVHEAIFEWLQEAQYYDSSGHLPIVRLCALLRERGLLDVRLYLQNIVARGIDLLISRQHPHARLHLSILRSIDVSGCHPAQQRQLRRILASASHKAAAPDSLDRWLEYRKHALQRELPSLLATEWPPRPRFEGLSTAGIREEVGSSSSDADVERPVEGCPGLAARAFYALHTEWLLPAIESKLSRVSADPSPANREGHPAPEAGAKTNAKRSDLDDECLRILTLLEDAEDWTNLSRAVKLFLRLCPVEQSYTGIFDACVTYISEYDLVWKCQDALSDLARALWLGYRRWTSPQQSSHGTTVASDRDADVVTERQDDTATPTTSVREALYLSAVYASQGHLSATDATECSQEVFALLKQNERSPPNALTPSDLISSIEDYLANPSPRSAALHAETLAQDCSSSPKDLLRLFDQIHSVVRKAHITGDTELAGPTVKAVGALLAAVHCRINGGISHVFGEWISAEVSQAHTSGGLTPEFVTSQAAPLADLLRGSAVEGILPITFILQNFLVPLSTRALTATRDTLVVFASQVLINLCQICSGKSHRARTEMADAARFLRLRSRWHTCLSQADALDALLPFFAHLLDIQRRLSTSDGKISEALAHAMRDILADPFVKQRLVTDLDEVAARLLDGPAQSSTTAPSESDLRLLSALLAVFEGQDPKEAIQNQLNTISSGPVKGETSTSTRGADAAHDAPDPGKKQDVARQLYLAAMPKLELRILLKEFSLHGSTSGDSAPPPTLQAIDAFSSRFVESLLSDEEASGRSLLTCLPPLNDSGRSQLGRAAVAAAAKQLRTSAASSRRRRDPARSPSTGSHTSEHDSGYRRLHQIATFIAGMLRTSDSTAAVKGTRAAPWLEVGELCNDWLELALDSADMILRPDLAGRIDQHLRQSIILCETLCAVARWIDVWSGNSDFLRGALKMLLDVVWYLIQLDAERHAPICATLLDMTSYLLDVADDSQAVQSLQGYHRVTIAHEDATTLHQRFRSLTRSSLPPAMLFHTALDGCETMQPVRPWEFGEACEASGPALSSTSNANISSSGGAAAAAHNPVSSAAARELASSNAGPIDLHSVKAQTLEVLDMACLAFKDPVMSQVKPFQRNFDSEIPTVQESAWQRDFRRSTTTQLELPPPPTTTTAAAAANAASSAGVGVAAGLTGSTGSAVGGAVGGSASADDTPAANIVGGVASGTGLLVSPLVRLQEQAALARGKMTSPSTGGAINAPGGSAGGGFLHNGSNGIQNGNDSSSTLKKVSSKKRKAGSIAIEDDSPKRKKTGSKTVGSKTTSTAGKTVPSKSGTAGKTVGSNSSSAHKSSSVAGKTAGSTGGKNVAGKTTASKTVAGSKGGKSTVKKK